MVRAVDFAVPLRSYTLLPLWINAFPHDSLSIKHRSWGANPFLARPNGFDRVGQSHAFRRIADKSKKEFGLVQSWASRDRSPAF
jgi:hypothetical protein